MGRERGWMKLSVELNSEMGLLLYFHFGLAGLWLPAVLMSHGAAVGWSMPCPAELLSALFGFKKETSKSNGLSPSVEINQQTAMQVVWGNLPSYTPV